MTFSTNPLTREQKLFAEAIVQLGNIAESLQVIAGVGATSSTRIEELQEQVNQLLEERSSLTSAVETLQAKVTEYEKPSDVTPDTIEEIMASLNIDYKS